MNESSLISQIDLNQCIESNTLSEIIEEEDRQYQSLRIEEEDREYQSSRIEEEIHTNRNSLQLDLNASAVEQGR